MNIYNELKLNEDILSHINYQMRKFQYVNIREPNIINMSVDVYNFIDMQSAIIYRYCNGERFMCELFGMKINIVDGLDKFISFGYDNFADNYGLCMRGVKK